VLGGFIAGGFLGYRVAGGDVSRESERAENLVRDIRDLESRLRESESGGAKLATDLGDARTRIGELNDRVDSATKRADLAEKRLSELQQSLENSAKLAEELAQSAKESATQASYFEASTTRLVKDLSKSNKERNLWRVAAMVAGSLAAIGWTMILWYP
jgi:chromosome segregation ATPase